MDIANYLGKVLVKFQPACVAEARWVGDAQVQLEDPAPLVSTRLRSGSPVGHHAGRPPERLRVLSRVSTRLRSGSPVGHVQDLFHTDDVVAIWFQPACVAEAR
ncbi:hypothetical protein [Alienimonas californiensis]|uniref:hypothetical protein n=1 Tax=Alienimonas californiensis TaxID=2527989 RepID=UPI00119D7599|nr:hypothetical protein [Alienimonas californiensis]